MVTFNTKTTDSRETDCETSISGSVVCNITTDRQTDRLTNFNNELTVVVVVAALTCDSKPQHDVLLFQSLVVVFQVLYVVNCLAQYSRLVQLTHTHTHT